MYQESEQGIWKSVLGALGAASVILTIVGNLVFAPKPSTLPMLKMAESEQPAADRSNIRRTSTVMVVPAVQSRQIDQSPSLDFSSKPNATTVNRPTATAPVESQKLPCDTASNILLAEQALPVEIQSGHQVDVAGRTVQLPMPPVATENPVLVAEQARAAGPAAPSELAPQAGPSIASQPVLVAPVDRSDLPDANPIPISVADACSPTPASQLAENGQSRALPVAVDNSTACVVVQKLSNYDRKLRRKIAHLEKKRNRICMAGCSLVCR